MDIRTLLWGWKKSQEIFPLISPSRRDMTQVYDYSVIIPAYNEEEFLPATLAALEQARNELRSLRGEFILVDNQSTDNTSTVAKQYGCTVVQETIRQIARVRNTGAKAAHGKYLIFVDADTIVPSATFRQALQALESGNYECGGARLSFDHNYGRWLSGRCLPALWNFISVKFHLFAGSFIFCKAELFFQCGGFPETHYAGEEIILSRKLKRACKKRGKKALVIFAPPVISSARKLLWYSDWSILKMILPLVGIPFFLRNHQACRFWYKRPTKD